MIIRKSTLFDVHNAINNFSDDEEHRDNYLLDWNKEHRTNPNFYSVVAIEHKKAIGLLNVIYKDGIARIVDLLSNGEEYVALINKMKFDLKPEVITVDAYTQEKFESLGFKLVQATYFMVWENPTEEKKEEVIVSGIREEVKESS